MGYYSRFALKVERDESMPTPAEAIAYLRDSSESAATALNENGGMEESVKWYDAVDDLKVLSQQFPHLVFTLDTEGEEAGDIQRHFFRRGESFGGKAEIRLPDISDAPWEKTELSQETK